jgi:IS5 family transposase
MYFLANGFNLSDEAREEALFAKAGELLPASGVKLSGGTIADATLIEAPSSTRNREKARDPEMHSMKKGNQWHFGMKVRMGAGSRTGLAHHANVAAAHVHGRHEVPRLLYGDETRFYGDSAYRGRTQRERLRELLPRPKDFTNRRACRNHLLSEAGKATNRRKSKVRAKVEHPFLVLKRIRGFAKAHYRGLARNAHRTFVLLALYHPVKRGKPLTGERCVQRGGDRGKFPDPRPPRLFFQRKSSRSFFIHAPASIFVQSASACLLVQRFLKI